MGEDGCVRAAVWVWEWDIRIAADSTMFLMVNLLIALSLGVHREQLEHLIGLTWPRPFLLRPLLVGSQQLIRNWICRERQIWRGRLTDFCVWSASWKPTEVSR